ncbi:hypothetical protein QQF64_034431 [Cirrhinus molitorella]|uniref:DNA-directed DNA polymerase n=1 Tax=Cirrhinus molitorella TaxID=172907 RepID=A0ABR3L4H6_9TELE
MPSVLNLTTTEKGYFPHHFNRVENENYVGPYPDKKFYGYENMSDKDQVKFDLWYNTLSGKVFHFKTELREYGVNDVVVIWEACMKYREAFIDCTELDTFNFTTLASCCMGVFKTRYLNRDTLAMTHNFIYYVDFTSLYSFCQARKSYPISHPKIIFNDFQPIENYYGLIKGMVYPPQGLLHPVLPFRCNSKLMFPLCRTCAHNENQTTSCTHTDQERALSGCWVSIELLKAIEKGYVVAQIDEVWHFPQRSDTLFHDYVKTFYFKTASIWLPIKRTFTTAHARLELYNLMDKLNRLLYSDTDSVIFVSRDGDWMPPLGDHLGELTDEIGDDEYITEFCSSGPKSYGYLTSKRKVCMKAKGHI